MANYVSSDKIRMFPSAFRKEVTTEQGTTTYNPDSHLNTEYNLTNLSARNTTKTGFVISYNTGTQEIEFSIMGYWFKAKITEVKVSGSPLWAAIKLRLPSTQETSDVYDRQIVNFESSGQTLENLDKDTGVFSGVYFSTSKPSGTNIYSLQLLDALGNIPKESKLRLTTGHIADGDLALPISEQLSTDKILTTVIENKTDGGLSISSDRGGIDISVSQNAQGPINISTADEDINIDASRDANISGDRFSIITSGHGNSSIVAQNGNIETIAEGTLLFKAPTINITNPSSSESQSINIGDIRNISNKGSLITVGNGIKLLGDGKTSGSNSRIEVSSTSIGLYSPIVYLPSSGRLLLNNNTNIGVIGSNTSIGTTDGRITKIYGKDIYADTFHGKYDGEIVGNSVSYWYSFMDKLKQAFEWKVVDGSHKVNKNSASSRTWSDTFNIDIEPSQLPFSPDGDNELNQLIRLGTIYFIAGTPNSQYIAETMVDKAIPLMAFKNSTADLPIFVSSSTADNNKGFYVYCPGISWTGGKLRIQVKTSNGGYMGDAALSVYYKAI